MKNIRITPAFVLLAAALICCENGGLIGALCAAVAAHEGGHLLLIRLWGGRVEQLTLGLGGMDIRYTCPRASYPKDAWIALAGPGANLLCCLLCAAPAQRLENEGLYLFLGCSGLLCLFTLLPALPLDGGVGLRALLLCRWEMERCDRALAVCGWCVGMALLAGFALWRRDGQRLEDYLAGQVFADMQGSRLEPDAADAAGFDAFLARFRQGLPVERAAAEHL